MPIATNNYYHQQHGIMNFTTSGSAGTNSQSQTPQRVSGLQGSDTLNIQQNQTSGGSMQASQQKEGEQNQQTQQQQQILIQPQLVQGGQALQALQFSPLSGQTFTTQAISQETLQEPSASGCSKLAPSSSGHQQWGPMDRSVGRLFSCRTSKFRTHKPRQSLWPQCRVFLWGRPSSNTTLTPIASAASIPAGTVTVNAAQLSSMPGLQTINLSTLSFRI